jgi:hypothetical protein
MIMSHLWNRCILESIIGEYSVKLCCGFDFECVCGDVRRKRLEESAVIPVRHVIVYSVPALKIALNRVSDHINLAFTFTNSFFKMKDA